MADNPTEETEIYKYDEYWLKQGRRYVENTITGLEGRFKRLMSFLNYLGGGIALGGITFSALIETKNPWVFGLIFFPLVSILFTKFYVGIETSSTIYKKVDLRSPMQIQSAHNFLVDKLRDRLIKAQEWVHISLCITAICLPLAVYINNLTKEIPESLVRIDKVSEKTIISGMLLEDQTVLVSFSGKMQIKKDNEMVMKDTVLDKEIKVKAAEDFKEVFTNKKLKINPVGVKVFFIHNNHYKTIEKVIN